MNTHRPSYSLRLRGILARLGGLGRRARDLFPFTPLGLLVLGLSAVALLRYGLRHIDLVLLVVGAVGLGLGVVALLVTTLTSLALAWRLRRLPEGAALKAECGYALRTGFSLPSLWYVPMVKLAWRWESPTARITVVPLRGRLHEELTPTHRGLYESITRRLEVSDAFGLTRVAFRFTEARGVRFFPSVGNLREVHVVRSLAGGDALSHPGGPPEGERVDLRHYAQGDPIKFVLWKVYARTRQLVVRTPERAISPVRQTVAYVVSGDGDEPAAGAARVAVDSGALGSEWVLGADGNDAFAKNPAQALEVLARSATTPDAQRGAGLARFLDQATPGATARAVVFVPATPGPWLERVVATARQRGAGPHSPSAVEFVVCTDGVDRRPRASWWARATLRLHTPDAEGDNALPLTPAGDLAQVLKALAGARARVLVVDRRAGRAYNEGHQRGLEAA